LRLTKRTMDALACDPGRKDRIFFDDDLPGFGLRVTDKGARTWLIQYRSAGTIRRMKLGSAGVLDPDKARDKAKELLGRVAGGSDPYADAKAWAEERRLVELAAAAAAKAEAFTLRQLISEYQAKYASRKRSGAEALRALRVNFADWLDRAANSFTALEMVKRLDHIAEDRGGAMANRTLAYARKMFNWATARQLVPASPLVGIQAPADEISRDRVLSKDELRAVWNATDALGAPFKHVVKLLILTLQRRQEVAGMRWSELSEDRSVWTIPAERAKNGKAHIVHLSSPAQAVLADVSSVEGCDLVFSTNGETRVSGFSKAKRRLDEKSKVIGWRFHDFRRTGVTELADLGFPPHVCDRLLNHVSGTISGVAAVYQRSEFLPERKRALEAWGSYVEGLASASGPQGNVIDIGLTRAGRNAASA
jgi:integrase